MKSKNTNTLFIFCVILFTSCQKQNHSISAFVPNILYLKYSHHLNDEDSSHQVLVKISDKNTELCYSYSFEIKDKYGWRISNTFYVPEKDKHSYIDTTNWFYKYATTKHQLQNKFAHMPDYAIDLYFRSFTYIYLIDLTSSHPSNLHLFKVVEVNPYNYFEHVDAVICGTGMLEARNTKISEWGKWLSWLYERSRH